MAACRLAVSEHQLEQPITSQVCNAMPFYFLHQEQIQIKNRPPFYTRVLSAFSLKPQQLVGNWQIEDDLVILFTSEQMHNSSLTIVLVL